MEFIFWLFVYGGSLLAIGYFKGNEHGRYHGYRKGWSECEAMVMKRAKHHEYPSKIVNDLLQ